MSSVTPEEFYARALPEQYAAATAGAGESVLAQPELTATVIVEGEGGGTYGLRAQGREFTYVPGGVESPDLLVRVGIEDWRAAVAHGTTEALLDYVARRKVSVVKGLKGTVTLELERDDGSLYRAATTFAGLEEPAVTIMMTADDYAAMLRGDLNGQMAFMMGKLKFEGSLPLLMAIGALAG